MPPRQSPQSDRQNPEYRKIDDRMNFAFHVAVFAAINSGLWFVQIIKFPQWQGAIWITGIWGSILLFHLIYILAIANYSVKSNG
ncbi:MAG: 2TM domain-containing protein [Prochloraceae cyanobacterium]